MDNTRLQAILSHATEFGLLYSYLDFTLAELDDIVGADLVCLKQYLQTEAGKNDFKADQFVDFLKEFKFYIQGHGTTIPANIDTVDYRHHVTQKLLSEEMYRVYGEIASKESEK